MSTAYRPPNSRRLNSGAWSRLKPSAIDSLENVGLPSKGETKYVLLLPCLIDLTVVTDWYMDRKT